MPPHITAQPKTEANVLIRLTSERSGRVNDGQNIATGHRVRVERCLVSYLIRQTAHTLLQPI